jgi:nucleotide-binding universal stress UspA family protein
MDEKILIPLDGSKIGEAALPYVEDLLAKLSPNVKLEVILLQVLSPIVTPGVGGYAIPDVNHTKEEMELNKKKAEEYLEKTAGKLKGKAATVTGEVRIGNAAEEIVRFAEEINANMIAMSTHGRSGLSRWAFGSVTDRVLRREGNIPVSVVRAPRKG